MTELPAGLRNLPRNASLGALRLDANALMVNGLRGLSDWPTLKQLDLRDGVELATPRHGIVLDVSAYAEDFSGIEVMAPRTRAYAL
ncbi:hypothetical protein [Streptomyces bauhiniae]|uniref:hypothetical protein n=1 Tax=Streptomyces bauhiniae TaxID=2340725 RepID=UPI001FCC6778|nr:hypothetical protein [Streptomyces bauhiniae]